MTSTFLYSLILTTAAEILRLSDDEACGRLRSAIPGNAYKGVKITETHSRETRRLRADVNFGAPGQGKLLSNDRRSPISRAARRSNSLA